MFITPYKQMRCVIRTSREELWHAPPNLEEYAVRQFGAHFTQFMLHNKQELFDKALVISHDIKQQEGGRVDIFTITIYNKQS